MSLGRIRALLRAELLALSRERAGLILLLLSLVLGGALGPVGAWLIGRLVTDEPPPESAAAEPAPQERPAKLPPCRVGSLPRAAAVGEVPEWLRWPESLFLPEEAQVLLRFGADGGAGLSVEVVDLDPEADGYAAFRCVKSRIAAERRARLDGLGISREDEEVVRVEDVSPPPTPAPAQEGGLAALPVSIVEGTLLGGLLVAIVSIFVDLGPRARASGWLETWLLLPGSRADLAAAWWIFGALGGAVAVGLGLVGDAIASAATGEITGEIPWARLPAWVAVLSAAGLRGLLDVPDQRAGLLRVSLAIPLLAALAGLAWLLEGAAAGLGGLVPVGGLALAAAGATAAPGLAIASSLAGAALLAASAARALNTLAVRETALGRAAARRARGDYLPEAALLALIALGGMTGLAPVQQLLDDGAARVALPLVLFVALPALLVATPLHLDRRELLSWRAPPRRAWLLLPLVVAGTLALAAHLSRLSASLFGQAQLLEDFAQLFRGLDTPQGLLALTLVPGVCEELLFRGAILGLLRRRFPAWAAILLQAAAFSLLHAVSFRLPHTFALGLIYGVLAVRAGSLWPGIAAHAAHNLLAIALPPALFAAWLDNPASWAVAALGLLAVWLSGGATTPRRTAR